MFIEWMQKDLVLLLNKLHLLPESEIATICRNLPQGIQDRGREIRTFMPKFADLPMM